MILLDTNYLIRSLVAGTPQAAQLDAWLIAGESISISSMAWCEFLCGPLSPDQAAAAATLISSVEAITVVDATRAAELFNKGGRRRGSLADCIIAATALRFGASLATENRADFVPFISEGLAIVPLHI
jgi:predicted nucleic acid-binding protein